ncbi:pentapeptide repeat-containing protein [Actinobacillus equuli]|uniref:pentapeptide repeat-containing protein n=1 Tax=Actinobacillus equuli TaxID=718 RepID=UPI003C6ECB0E
MNFEHSIFSYCSMRNVSFQNCSFINCQFEYCDFKDSCFINCDLRYSKFVSTYVDIDILNSSPREHNLKLKFARNLRVNFDSLGLEKYKRKAQKMELEAQREFLYKCWSSEDSYYDKKYSSIQKTYKFLEWIKFKLNDWIWGHGESIKKCIISTLLFLLLISLYITLSSSTKFYETTIYVIAYFIGSIDNNSLPNYFSLCTKSIIIILRIISSGLLLSILIQNLSKR